MSAEERYNSIYTGTEIDAALGRIISGEIDEAVKKAEAAQAGAEAAQTKAETAQAAAESARQGAETAQTKAGTAQAAAEAARQGAETAQTKAETGQAAAEAAKTAAQQAAADASASAQQAAESAAALSDTIDDVSDLKAGLAKNTAADAATKRSLDALWKLNQGVSYQFETDTTEAYSKTVPTGAKCADVQMIGGKTLVWNQLINATPDTWIKSQATVTLESDGYYNIKYVNGTNDYAVILFDSYSTVGHAYLMLADLKVASMDNITSIWAKPSNFGNTRNFASGKLIETVLTNGRPVIGFSVKDKTVDTSIGIKDIHVIDLTQLFGSGNEPTTTDDPRIAWIEQYAAAHPEYNAGELVSADVESVDAVGFNIWDEEWQNGYYNAATGVFVSNPTAPTLACKNKIPVLQSATYYFRYIYGSSLSVFEYDSSGNFLRRTNMIGSAKTLTTTQETVLIAFHIAEYGNGVYNHDVCINLSDTNKNGEYRPYNKTNCNIPSAVRALPGYGWSAGDVYNSIERTDKGWQYVQRVGSVDIGTLTYSYDATNKNFYSTGLSILIKSNTNDEIANIICAIYTAISRNSFVAGPLTDDMLTFVNAQKTVCFRNLAYTDADAFKSAMSGVMLYYELATPVITDITDMMTLDFDAIPVEAGGTVTFDNAAHLPVPNSIEYAVKLSEVSG